VAELHGLWARMAGAKRLNLRDFEWMVVVRLYELAMVARPCRLAVAAVLSLVVLVWAVVVRCYGLAMVARLCKLDAQAAVVTMDLNSFEQVVMRLHGLGA